MIIQHDMLVSSSQNTTPDGFCWDLAFGLGSKWAKIERRDGKSITVFLTRCKAAVSEDSFRAQIEECFAAVESRGF